MRVLLAQLDGMVGQQKKRRMGNETGNAVAADKIP